MPIADRCNRYARRRPKSHQREADYAYARAKAGHHLERGYDLASGARNRNVQLGVEREFRKHVEQWKNDTQHCSSVLKMIAHPSYLRIIGLAGVSQYEMKRLLLRELEAEPDHWFAALAAVTGENPVLAEHDFDESVNAWLEWGREGGLL